MADGMTMTEALLLSVIVLLGAIIAALVVAILILTSD